MKNLFSLFAAAALVSVVALFGCDDKPGIEPGKEITLIEGNTNQIVYADENVGTDAVKFKTTGEWRSAITEDANTRATTTWVKITPSRGFSAGDYTVSITLDENYSGQNRTATITITSGDAVIEITVTQKSTDKDGGTLVEPNRESVVINGVTWATRNVAESGGKFVARPENYGGYFTFDEAQTACPEGWRLPSPEESVSLFAAGIETDLENGGYDSIKENGVKGIWLGRGEDRVFFPAAGNIIDGKLDWVGRVYQYWLSMPAWGNDAYAIYNGWPVYRHGRNYGRLSVRCVEAADPIIPGSVTIWGVTWATRNVDAAGTFTETPEDYGGYFTFDEAQTACPEGWRLPVEAEYMSLCQAGNRWTTVNGVNGWTFSYGASENSLFLPAAGPRDGLVPSRDEIGEAGYYWANISPEYYYTSSEDMVDEYENHLAFHSDNLPYRPSYASIFWGEGRLRSDAISVRCVWGK